MDKLANMDEYDLSIETSDTSILLQQLQEAPDIYWHYVRQLETAKRLVADLKLDISVLEAVIAKRLREGDKNVSEAKVNRLLYEDGEYVEKNRQLNVAKAVEGKLSGFLRSLEHRQSIMMSIVSLIRAELRQQI